MQIKYKPQLQILPYPYKADSPIFPETPQTNSSLKKSSSKNDYRPPSVAISSRLPSAFLSKPGSAQGKMFSPGIWKSDTKKNNYFDDVERSKSLKKFGREQSRNPIIPLKLFLENEKTNEKNYNETLPVVKKVKVYHF